MVINEEHSKYFIKVKNYYDKGLWNKSRVKKAVDAGWITINEYYEITGELYPT